MEIGNIEGTLAVILKNYKDISTSSKKILTALVHSVMVSNQGAV